ncbi:MAG: hypothetical protein R3A10_01280 [Caldilineaceae bacterium]
MCLGIPGRITEKYERDGVPMGKADFGGISKEHLPCLRARH